MPVPAWPSTLPLRPRAQSLNASPRRMVAAFEPEQGVEISRPRVSAAIHVVNFETPALDSVQAATLRTFMEDTLRGGAIAFSWIDPRTGEAWLWKPTPDTPYRENDLGGGFTQFSFSLVRQPGRPWWSTQIVPNDPTVPLLVLDFQNAAYGRPPSRENITDILNFTRASTGTYRDTDGVLKTAAVNVPRIDSNGLIIEGARTNLAFRSQEIDNAVWSKTESTVSANVGTAPDGTVSADLIVPSVNNLDHRVRQTIAGVVSGNTYTPSVFLKRGGYSWARVSIGSTFATNYIFVNLLTGALGLNTGVTGIAIESWANDWWRVSGSMVATGTGSGVLDIFPLNGNTFTTFAGDGTSGILAWGVQLEAGAGPTSYIPTTAAAVARSQDTVSLIDAISDIDLRVVNRSGVVTDALSQSLAAGAWPAGAAAGARRIVAYPAGVLA